MGGYIPESFINDLIARVSISEVIAARGVELRKSGNDLVGCCPFHNEKSPSFNVSLSKQVYHCFGCGVGGGVVQFIQEYDGVDFVTAIEQLAGIRGITVPYTKTNIRPEIVDLYTVNARAAEFFQQQLKFGITKDVAIAYLKSRGINGTTAKYYGIGFAPDGWKNLYNHFGTNKELQDQIQNSGLVTCKAESKNYYDRFRNRIMFPIRDARGRTIGFGGRDLGNDAVKYINSPETAVFKKGEELYGLYEAKAANRKLEQVLVVEGYFDVVVLANAGINNAVASLGTAITSKHLNILFKTTTEIIFCFDGDNAGRKAAWRALELCLPLLQDGYLVKFLLLPDGSDPDSYVCAYGADKFRSILKNAKTLPDYLFAKLASQVDLHEVDGKAKLVALAKPVLNSVGSHVLQQLLYNKLTELSGLDLQARSSNNVFRSQKTVARNHNVAYLASPALRAVAILLRHRSLLQDLPDLASIAASAILEVRLLYAVANILHENSAVSLEQIQAALPRELARKIISYELAAIVAVIPETGLLPELLDAVARTKVQERENNLEKLLQRAAESSLSAAEKLELRAMLAQKC